MAIISSGKEAISAFNSSSLLDLISSTVAFKASKLTLPLFAEAEAGTSSLPPPVVRNILIIAFSSSSFSIIDLLFFITSLISSFRPVLILENLLGTIY